VDDAFLEYDRGQRRAQAWHVAILLVVDDAFLEQLFETLTINTLRIISLKKTIPTMNNTRLFHALGFGPTTPSYELPPNLQQSLTKYFCLLFPLPFSVPARATKQGKGISPHAP
jgi:hypothetical protein